MTSDDNQVAQHCKRDTPASTAIAAMRRRICAISTQQLSRLDILLWSVTFFNKATIARSVTILFGLLNMVETDARVKVEIISTQDKIAVVKIVGKIKSEEDLELKQ